MHFAPIAILPCQELAIRHAEQVLDEKISIASIWETRNQNKLGKRRREGERETQTQRDRVPGR